MYVKALQLELEKFEKQIYNLENSPNNFKNTCDSLLDLIEVQKDGEGET